jgi:agmatine/peptidylarginine deiminase
MEAQLKTFRTLAGEPYRLIALPMARPAFEDDERIPATYANYLVINGAVLVPTYDTDLDAVALAQVQKAFPQHEIVGIDCQALIRQHGSLHCVTMQYPL